MAQDSAGGFRKRLLAAAGVNRGFTADDLERLQLGVPRGRSLWPKDVIEFAQRISREIENGQPR